MGPGPGPGVRTSLAFLLFSFVDFLSSTFMSCTPLSVSGGVGPFPACQSLHTFLFSNPYQHTPNAHPHFNPDHTFDGQPIPPYRPAIVHAGTGAQISWARVRADSLRVARAVREITGEPVRWEDVKERVGEPVHAPRTTLLLHLPNTLSWPIIAFGALGALCTVSPVSPLLTPRELAYVLAKSRPQILVSSAGSEGYDRLRSALALLLDAPHGEGPGALAGVPESEVRAWAKELARVWDAPCESLSWKEKRVWTVDVAGEADYYGTGRSAKGLVAHDSRDWTNLLEPPVGHGHGGTMDNLQREAFEVKEFEEGEQERRVAL